VRGMVAQATADCGAVGANRPCSRIVVALAPTAVDDYAIIVTLRSPDDCSKFAQTPAVEIGGDVAVLLAFER
jgi:hypothetical protein